MTNLGSYVRFALVCDACGHKVCIPTPSSDEDCDALVGTPCPSCGANLLTEASANQAKKQMALLRDMAGAELLAKLPDGDPGNFSIQGSPDGNTLTVSHAIRYDETTGEWEWKL